MSKYKMFFLHDPIGNVERQITDFNKETIQRALNQGLIVIGLTQDNNREIVKNIDDIVEPQTATVEGITMVLPSYVDSKVEELTNIVEKLVDGLEPSQVKPSLLSNIKNSIQEMHEKTLKTIERDKKMIESSPSIVKKEET